MSAYHQELVGRAEQAIDAVFGDASVPRGTTKDDLRGLRERIDECLQCLREDERREQREAAGE